MRIIGLANLLLLTLPGNGLGNSEQMLLRVEGEGGFGSPKKIFPTSTIREQGKKNRFNEVLPEFGPSVTNPYRTCTELRGGIALALKSLADATLDREVNNSFCRNIDKRQPTRQKTSAPQEQAAETAPQEKAADPVGEDSFETNNQVEGVDEADVVKSDGSYIFMAYGEELIMMNLKGVILDRVTCETEQKEGGANVKSILLHAESKTVTAIAFDYRGQTLETVAHVYTYRTGQLEKIRNVVIPGRYEDARSIESNAHIVTAIPIRTYTLTSALNRCNTQNRELSDEEYEEAAFKEATVVINNLVDEILKQLELSKWDCSSIVRISTMTDADEDSTETEEDRALDVRAGGGILNNFIRVTSFDMSDSGLRRYNNLRRDNGIGGGFQVQTAGAFIPTYNTEIFASADFIVVAGRGYRRINQGGATNVWSQYTYLIAFKVQGTQDTVLPDLPYAIPGLPGSFNVLPAAVGSVKGYLLNQFSMDFFDGILRVATTNNRRWGFLNGRWQQIAESSSQVSKLEFTDRRVGGRMKLVGQLEGLGTTETIFAVRFVRERGYVVTFRQIDPLFVIDMVPDTPVVLGELKITGFSNFLQPIGENDEFLLGIGQEVDEATGRRLGLKISLFDVSDPTSPQEAQSHVVQGYSSSAAQFESKAFRYLPISKKLILPVSVYGFGDDNFDGFVVFDIDVQGINRVGEVTHADRDRISNTGRFYCYSRANLEPRSLVFAGNLITLKGHTVKYSEGLESLEAKWTTDLDEGRDGKTDICYPYFPQPRPVAQTRPVAAVARIANDP